jgi:hypothetical protein
MPPAQDTAGKVESGVNPFDAWIHIKPDSSAELVLAQSEMGQGVYTSLPMLLAEEADLDWERVTVVQSDSTKGTGGSGSVRSNYLPLRRAGTHGGVTGKASDRLPMSIPWPALETRVAKSQSPRRPVLGTGITCPCCRLFGKCSAFHAR